MNSLKTLLYFSLFKYPLTKEELFKFSDAESRDQIENEITICIEKGLMFKIQEFYCHTDDPNLITRRLKGNKNAKQIMPKALKVSKLIAKFPYVEGVGISGSLSKGYYDTKNGDIDFFVITKPNRLWVSRTLLMLYKKVFLLNSKKYFCANYFISSSQLEISEQNRFTATETLTLIPTFGKDVFKTFYEENLWAKSILPNLNVNLESIKNINRVLLSRVIEFLCNGKFGDTLDSFFKKITIKKWNSKFSHLNKKQFDIALKSTKNVSKHHPQDFQRKVIDRLNVKYAEVEKQHNLELIPEYA